MATKRLIDLHKEWCACGRMNDLGLCNSIPNKYRPLLILISPDIKEYRKVMKNGVSFTYWAYDGARSDSLVMAFSYTPLRQTIVLLICAMKNEI